MLDRATTTAVIARRTVLRMRAPRDAKGHVGEARRKATGVLSGGFALGWEQPRAQLEHGLGVDLAHPALGHAEDLADLGQRQAFVVVEREHDLLALGHPIDRLERI